MRYSRIPARIAQRFDVEKAAREGSGLSDAGVLSDKDMILKIERVYEEAAAE